MDAKKKYALITFLTLGWLLDFFDLFLYSFLLEPIQAEFSLTNTEVGLIYSASLAVTALGGILLGYVGDKYGRKPAIIISIAIYSLGTALSGMATGVGSLLVFRLITGLGIGGEWAAGHTLINESLPSGERGRSSSIIQAGAPAGAALAAFMGGFITPHIGWRMSFIIASAPSFILVVLMLFMLDESPQWLIFKSESSDVIDLNEDGIPRGMAYVRAATKRTISTLKPIRKELTLGTFLSLWGMIAYWIIYSWTPKYLSTIGFTAQAAASWMLLSQLGAFIGYLSYGYIADFVGSFKKTFSGFALIFAAGVFVFTTGNGMGSSAVALTGIFFAGLGTGFFSGYGPIYSRLFPVKVRNSCSSWCFNFGRMGAFIAPVMVAQLAITFGFGFAISLASIFALILSVWIFLIPLREGKEALEYENKILEEALAKESTLDKEKKEKILLEIKH